MSKYKDIVYYPAMSVAENASINKVEEKDIRYFIRSRGIDRRNQERQPYISKIKAYLKEHPNATRKETANALALGINTVRKYWDIAVNDGDSEQNCKKALLRKQRESKAINYLNSLPIEFIQEYLTTRVNLEKNNRLIHKESNTNNIISTHKFAYFYMNTPLSNWWTSPPIPYDGYTFSASESLFMYLKAKGMGDKEYALRIVEADNDTNLSEKQRFSKVKRLGKKCKFDEAYYLQKREEWMFTALSEKFKVDATFREVLMADEYRGLTFVEASPFDKIWGIKTRATKKVLEEGESAWKGLNLLGKLLTKLRDDNQQP